MLYIGGNVELNVREITDCETLVVIKRTTNILIYIHMLNRFLRKRTDDSKKVNQPSIDLNKIYPIIKGKTSNGTTPDLENIDEPINVEFVDNLLIYFALDKDDSFAYINKNDLKNIGKQLDEIKTIAIDNLIQYFSRKGVSIEGDENMLMVKFDHNMESSLLLVDSLWTQIIATLNDELIIAVPSRELLLITTKSNDTAINQLREGAIDLYSSGRYKLTQNLLIKCLDGTLKRYK